jgi:hypothetical protein
MVIVEKPASKCLLKMIPRDMLVLKLISKRPVWYPCRVRRCKQTAIANIMNHSRSTNQLDAPLKSSQIVSPSQ